MGRSFKFRNRVISLDSCHSGAVGKRPTQRTVSEISKVSQFSQRPDLNMLMKFLAEAFHEPAR